ncbi:hypothetical protein ECG_09554 [Echinococcus granulosus]|nr:hypothetical protein ECG_09554 [Echinococcus granulosus]
MPLPITLATVVLFIFTIAMTTWACQSEIQRLHLAIQLKRVRSVKTTEESKPKAFRWRANSAKNDWMATVSRSPPVNQPCVNVFCTPSWLPCHYDCDCCEGLRCEKDHLPSLCAPPVKNVGR